MNKVLVTKLGFDLHMQQLEEQKSIIRDRGAEVGEEAGINCDWHDNFGYEDARRQLEKESTRLRELMNVALEIVEIQEQAACITIGNTIKYYQDEDDIEKEITIGAYGESAPAKQLISYQAPIARALLGAKRGETRECLMAGKMKIFEIIEILPPSYKYWRLIGEIFKK